MKIYQTTFRSFYLYPKTDEIVANVIDITDDIKLNADMNKAMIEHKKLADIYSDEDLFNVTSNDNKVHIENDDIYLSNIIEIVTDDYIVKIVIETITREV